ncbi:MAG TPA: ABC transporter permease [Opitutaceae bacterium]|nr:ABC transporter permease [Opitutaceae bacterium]
MFQDLRLARRFLWKDRTFAFLAILVLTLGIGGVATQFSVLNGMLLRLPAFPHAERLMAVSLVDTTRNQPTGGAGVSDYLDWQAMQRSFESLALYGARLSINVTFQNTPRRYGGVYVTHPFFRTLGVTPVLGRDFTAADDQPGAPKTIIISDQTWKTDFGGRPDIIGQPVSINGRPGTVIGVMPPGFAFPLNEQVWTPAFAEFIPRGRDDPQTFGGALLGRLRPGVTVSQAVAEFTSAAQRFAADYPQTNGRLTAVQVVPFAQTFLGPQVRQILYLMLGAVAIVLLIACVNVMNMQFARATRRTRDLAISSALGASRWRLLRQMLVENLLLAAAGALAGSLFAIWASDALLQHSRTLPVPPPSWVSFDLDGRVLLLIVATTVGAAILSGLVPAWLASRSRPIDLLREGGRGGTSRKTTVIIRALVVLQIALSAALLIASTFMIRSMVNQQRIDWGYDTSEVLAGRMTLFQADHPTPEALGRFYDRILQTLRADSHFSNVALTTRFRLAISNRGGYEVDGETYAADRPRPTAAIESISDGYFAGFGMKLVAGRDFTAADSFGAPAVALVNGAFARRHFGNDNPVGRRLRIPQGGGPASWATIVGVAPDTRMQGPYDGESDGAGIFLPLRQAPARWITIVVRGQGGSPLLWADPLRRAMATLDPNLPIYMINTVDQLIDATYAQNRLLAGLFSIFGGVAMLLAAVGLYGVMSFAVSQRTCEYGIRMALGADPRMILAMILREGTGQLAIGLVLGLALALVLVTLGAAFMRSFLYHVNPADPMVWGSTVGMLTVVTLLACLAPARRATRVNPVDALRAE